jgi:hypothetical protein
MHISEKEALKKKAQSVYDQTLNTLEDLMPEFFTVMKPVALTMLDYKPGRVGGISFFIEGKHFSGEVLIEVNFMDLYDISFGNEKKFTNLLYAHLPAALRYIDNPKVNVKGVN